MKGQSHWVSLKLVAALVRLWVGERIVDRGTSQWVFSGLGAAAVVVALAWRALRRQRATAADRRSVETTLLGLHALAALAVALYFVQSDGFAKVAGQSLDATAPKLAGVLGALWPAAMAASLWPTLLVELAYAAMARAPKLEVARVREALMAGLGFAFALTFAFATQYVVTERDVKKDFSYFRVARPGDATKKLVQSFDEKVEVVLFYPPASDVAEFVTAYVDELKENAPMLTVSRLDYALEPTKAKEYGVTGNGTIVVKKGARKENLFTGTEAEKSRT